MIGFDVMYFCIIAGSILLMVYFAIDTSGEVQRLSRMNKPSVAPPPPPPPLDREYGPPYFPADLYPGTPEEIAPSLLDKYNGLAKDYWELTKEVRALRIENAELKEKCHE